MVVEVVTFGKAKEHWGRDVKPVYWCHGFCGNVYVSLIGHTRLYAINKALREITRVI